MILRFKKNFYTFVSVLSVLLVTVSCTNVKMDMDFLASEDSINKIIELPLINNINKSSVRFNGVCRDQSNNLFVTIQDTNAVPQVINLTSPCVSSRFSFEANLSTLSDGEIRITIISEKGFESKFKTIKDVVEPTFSFVPSATVNIHQGSVVNHTLNFNEGDLKIDRTKIRLTGDSQGCVLNINEYIFDSRRWGIEIKDCSADGHLALSFDAGAFTDRSGNATNEQLSLGGLGVFNKRTQLTWTSSLSQTISASGQAVFPLMISHFTATPGIPSWPGVIGLLEASGDSAGCTLSESGVFPNFELRVTGCSASTGNVQWRFRKDLIPNPAGLFNLESDWSANLRVDNTAPTITLVNPVAMTGSSGTTFTWQVQFVGADNILLNNSHILLSGNTDNCAVTTGGVGSTRSVSVSGCSISSGTVAMSILPGAASDIAGNQTAGLNGGSLTIVNSGPTLSIGTPSVSAINASGALEIPLVYTNAASVSLAAGDISLLMSGTVSNCQINLLGSGLTSRTVRITNCQGDGDVKIQIAAGTALGATAILAGAAGPSAPVIVDNTAPTYTVTSTGGSVKGGPFDVTLAFNESVTNVSNIFSVNDGSISNFTVSSSQLSLRISPTLTVEVLSLSSTPDVIRDIAGNSLAISTQTFTIGLPPLITLATSDGRSSYSELFQFDVISNRNISAPTAASFQYSGMTIGIIIGAFNRYTAYATPQTTSMSLAMPANKVLGVPSGLGNVASNTLNLTYVPPLTIGFDQSLYEFQETNVDTVYNLRVTMSSVRSYPVSVDLEVETHQGDSLSGFASLVNQTVTFPAGSVSVNIPVTVYGNATADGIKRSFINLKSNQSHIRFGIANARMNIIDDEEEAYASIQTSSDRICVITNSGTLKCWGKNKFGQVGDGTFIDKLKPTIIDGGVNYSQVALGSTHTCGITTTGVLKCWGYNNFGQVGDGTTSNKSSPMVIDGGVSYSKIVVSLASSYSCGITTSGVLKCWGYNGYGQLGDGTTASKNSPVVIDGGTNYSQIVVSSSPTNFYAHTCGITASNVLKCWGYNGWGALGDGSTTSRTTPVVIDSGTDYSKIEISYFYSCGITSAGVLKCWGYNGYGQLGDGSVTSRTTPVVIDSGTDYSKIEISYFYSCGITSAGVLKCWGSNGYGQLGDGTVTDRLTPVVIDSGVTYSQIKTEATNGASSCGITTSGSLKCWGSNGSGQLGDATSVNRSSPVLIDSGVSYSQISLSGYSSSTYSYTCGITTTSALKCWGSNEFSQFGDGHVGIKTTPMIIDSAVNYMDVSLTSSLCGVSSSGILKCQGLNDDNVLGDGTSINRSSLVLIDSGSTYSKISVGDECTCGITLTGILKCWGKNYRGQVGDGSNARRMIPVVVDSGTSYLEVSTSKGYSIYVAQVCGITSSGALKCWGSSYGSVPVAVDSGVSYSHVSSSSYFDPPERGHACGITNLGVLKCWGKNYYGQLGDGSKVDKATPVEIDSGVSYSMVAVGSNFSCGVTTSGILQCWGDNGSGGLGDGTTTDRLLPVAIDSSTTYAQISLGNSHSCGVTTTGVLKCWGTNSSGQLGDGTLTSKLTPTVIDSGTTYSKVHAGAVNTCAITTAGVLKCWGSNLYGVLSLYKNPSSSTPVRIY